MEQELERVVRRKKPQHMRPSIVIENPEYQFNDESTSAGPGRENPFNDMSSYDDSYSGSDLDEDSFAGSDGSTGILSPEEIDKHEKHIIARKEHQRVFRARIFVLVLLLITAVSNSVIVYFLTSNNEVENYTNRYNELADGILQVTNENIQIAFLSMDAMSKAMTTRVLDDPDGSDSTWPMVTLPTFSELAEDVRNVSGAILITLAPIVTEDQRPEWERYSVANQWWLTSEDHTDYFRNRRLKARLSSSNSSSREQSEHSQQSPAFTTSTPELGDVEARSYPTDHLSPRQFNQSASGERDALIQPTLQNHRRQQEGRQFRGVIPARIHPVPTREERFTPGMQYAPLWQSSPPPYYRGIVNYDLERNPSFQRLSQIVNDTRQAVISNLLDDDLVKLLLEQPYQQENVFSEYYPTPDHSHGEQYPPSSIMVQPVWDDLAISEPTLAAYLIAVIPWGAYLIDTFRPDSQESILARYEAPRCEPGTMLNFELYGGEQVLFVGDIATFPGYESYVYDMSSAMNFPLQPIQTLEMVAGTATGNVTGSIVARSATQPLDCIMELSLFPSQALQDRYLTNMPIYYALLIFVIFIILSLAFFIYDCVVERRRGRVMAIAEKTGRIVTSLFPGQFADQLIAEDKKKEKDEKKKRKKKLVIEEAPNRQLKKFMDKKPNGKGKRKMEGSSRYHALGYDEGSTDGAGESPLFLAQSKPIADLFPETTVLFADIAGFTAWSSVREPSQVFTLLETVYQNFDYLAKQYGIFKIETIGDCYVAVCGLPEPRADHAVAMSRFALACMQKMKMLVSQLEVSLGPDTGDLTMRFGLHSGPVTAGVLRGERARFQLFGDTVNTAARMESTGLRDKIQISQETADLLVAVGKAHWFTKREGLVKAKGKGDLQTYWLVSSIVNRRISMGGCSDGNLRPRRHSMGARTPSTRDLLSGSQTSRLSHGSTHRLVSVDSDGLVTNPLTSLGAPEIGKKSPGAESSSSLVLNVKLTTKQQRLVDWNCELLQQIIRQIVARRNFLKNTSNPIHIPFQAIKELPKIGGMMIQQGTSSMPLDEVVEVINLPEFEVAAYHGNTDAKHIKLDPSVVTQLKRFVSVLASKYRDNPFHNFEHASHVTMSVSKLLTRIVAPDLASINDRHDNNDMTTSVHLTNDMKDLHDHTYGITSDPLTQLAVVMSALIHDVDHRGVSNNILIQEEPEMAAKYRNKSVAEQNSIDVAWELFMDDNFKCLREVICPEYTELRRFRQIIVSSVLATDIFDPELSSLRKSRWIKAFPPAPDPVEDLHQSGLGKDRRTSFNVGGLSSRANGNTNNRNDINRKATIVIEHLIQASDVSHTMQHWHIYQKWNECLFQEMYNAYNEGRSDKDPSEGWYKGEIWFFENYIIPLAKKLKECGVFGVSSDEYLDYATANRTEWEEKGEAIVEDMISKYKDAKGPVDKASLGYE